MSAFETRLVDADQVAKYATLPDVMRAVEAAFAAYSAGSARMPAKSYVDLPKYNGDFRSMPAYVDVSSIEIPERSWHAAATVSELGWDAAGVKWVNVHTDNRERFGLPTVLGTYIYSDPANGYPLGLIDGRELTRRRTGAAAGIATDLLAAADATSMGIIGAGEQAETQLDAVTVVRDIRRVVVHDRNPERVQAFVDRYSDRYDIHAGTIADAGHCDILSTITPVESPIVGLEDVGPETHINAIGADAVGKHELSDALLQDAVIVIDDYEQCTHSGEINVPWSEGLLTDTDLYGELGDLVSGSIPSPDGGRSVFDSTGLAIQDVAAARVAYERATTADAGTVIDLLGV